MRWPIRNQILLPFLAIQCTTLAVVVIASAWTAVDQAEAELNARLSNVMGTLEQSTFPLTTAVLNQLRPLSGAEFVVLDREGRIRISTLKGIEGELSLSANKKGEGWNLVDMSAHATVSIRDKRYFAGRVVLKGRQGTGAVIVLYPEEHWISARQEALYPPLTIGGVALLLTVAASVWISRRIGNRIHDLGGQVSRIAGGNFEPIELSPLNDELMDLSKNVNSMCKALQESWSRIRETERSILVTQIVGGIAHQLRNAITGARISLQLHRGRCARGNDEAIEVSLQQLTLVEELIKGLLRLTRGESRTCFPKPIAGVIDEVISLVKPICAHKQMEFTYTELDSQAHVPDGDALRAAILNLLMNGIEAAGPHGALDVRGSESQGKIMIEIRDNGPGVSPELEEKIFQPFYSTKPEGIGLGLSLARQAAEDCRGTLSLHREDGWTIFRLLLGTDSVAEGRAEARSQVMATTVT